MSRKQNTSPQKNVPRGKSEGRGFLFPALVIAVAGLVSLALWSSHNHSIPSPPSDVPPGTNAAASTQPPQNDFQTLLGKWVRPDGGYILQIKAADEKGTLDVAYFNPNPIHVARAEASGQGSLIKVFVELRDVNYPGSTYTLAYDRSNDVLKGIYYQALEQQTFEVFFDRSK